MAVLIPSWGCIRIPERFPKLIFPSAEFSSFPVLRTQRKGRCGAVRGVGGERAEAHVGATAPALRPRIGDSSPLLRAPS